MLTIDFIGLLFTACLTGIRYPHYVLLATLIHELGRICMTMFLHGSIEAVVAAGAFGSTFFSKLDNSVQGVLIIFSGPLANYIACSVAQGVATERTGNLINPFLGVRHPFAVVNLRFAILSVIFNIWHFVGR